VTPRTSERGRSGSGRRKTKSAPDQRVVADATVRRRKSPVGTATGSGPIDHGPTVDLTDDRHRILLDTYAPEPAVRVGSALRELRRQLPALCLLLWNPDEALEPTQQDALETLARVYPQGVPIKLLAETLRIDASTTSRVVDRLIARKLATKTRLDVDGRVLLVKPTAACDRMLSASYWPGRAHYAKVLEAAFDQRELEQLAGFLVRLVSVIDAAVDEQCHP
jgi:DNA-binding MarR family transcriptional regulator